MPDNNARTRARAAAVHLLAMLPLGAASAQSRRVLPAGTVILVSTRQALESNAVRTGDTFDTEVVDTLAVDGYTVIPSRSRIRGVVTFAQPATRQESGVIEVSFDRVTLTDGTQYPMSAKLTSTDSAERRQIDSNANARVVLLGTRGGLGPVIAGASSSRSAASGIIGALSGLLSEGRDVSLPPGSRLAVQLREPLSLRTRGIARTLDAGSMITAGAI